MKTIYINIAMVGLLMAMPVYAQEAMVHDMSPLGMYQSADVVVKSVILLLVGCSVSTWTIFLFKVIQFGRSLHQLKTVQAQWQAVPYFSPIVQAGGYHAIFDDLIQEVRDELSLSKAFTQDVYDRVEYRLQKTVQSHLQHLKRGLSILATIGSTAPFIGLFGTVWGIMHSFIGITQAKTTSLMVVAPGIAEALFATALGLVAAIPAVMMYNALQRCLADYQVKLSHLAGLLFLMLKREGGVSDKS